MFGLRTGKHAHKSEQLTNRLSAQSLHLKRSRQFTSICTIQLPTVAHVCTFKESSPTRCTCKMANYICHEEDLPAIKSLSFNEKNKHHLYCLECSDHAHTHTGKHIACICVQCASEWVLGARHLPYTQHLVQFVCSVLCLPVVYISHTLMLWLINEQSQYRPN